MSKDSLGDRMKEYEQATAVKLTKNMPVLIRVDGKAFHTYTKGLERPFDQGIINAMWEVAKTLCSEIQGAQVAYVQSDEISIFVHNYKSQDQEPWFDNKLQKMVSVPAGIASGVMTLESEKVFGKYKRACFDNRVWLLPPHEVNNYFLWRQQDWSRNSVQMLARSLFSHKQCHGKNNVELKEMCSQQGKSWNDLPTYLRRGACIVKETYEASTGAHDFVPFNHQIGTVERTRWAVDKEIPIFTQDRAYINDRLEVKQ